MPTPPKMIYLAKRNPALTYEQFIRRWRKHGALGMSTKQWARVGRYAHCDVLREQGNVPRGSDEYDGIGVVWFRSPESPFQTIPEETDMMRRDELETFSENVFKSLLMTEEKVIKPGWGAIKLSGFVTRKEGMSREDFSRHWAEVHGPLTVNTPELSRYIRRYVQNHVISSPISRNSRLEYDGVADLWFDSVEDATRFFAEPAYQAVLRPDTEKFIATGKSMRLVTKEWILYDFMDMKP